jgi:hypothetical protein
MSRLFWYAVVLMFVAGLLLGASYAAAYSAVGTLLGAPPPVMGRQSTTLLWKGAPELRGHPRVWRISYSPTLIPGASSVRIYISPGGKIVYTVPEDLRARLATFHNTGY